MKSTGETVLIQRYKQIKIKLMGKYTSCKQQHKKAGVPLLISEEIKLKTKNIRGKGRYL